MSKQSKSVTLPAEFLRAASIDPQGSLAYMILSAFGVTLAQCLEMVKTMVASNDVKVMLFCITAGVQIRGNTVYVGAQYGDIRKKYPQLVVEGTRDVKDTFNFGACHVCGHLLAHLSTTSLSGNILRKAGSCITGEYATETEAGKINAEIAKGFNSEDKIAFGKYNDDLVDADQTVVDAVFDSIPKLSASFATAMNPTSTAAAT